MAYRSSGADNDGMVSNLMREYFTCGYMVPSHVLSFLVRRVNVIAVVERWSSISSFAVFVGERMIVISTTMSIVSLSKMRILVSWFICIYSN